MARGARAVLACGRGAIGSTKVERSRFGTARGCPTSGWATPTRADASSCWLTAIPDPGANLSPGPPQTNGGGLAAPLPVIRCHQAICHTPAWRVSACQVPGGLIARCTFGVGHLVKLSWHSSPRNGRQELPRPSRLVGGRRPCARSEARDGRHPHLEDWVGNVVGELPDLSYTPGSPCIVRLPQASTVSAASLDHDAQPSSAPQGPSTSSSRWRYAARNACGVSGRGGTPSPNVAGAWKFRGVRERHGGRSWCGAPSR